MSLHGGPRHLPDVPMRKIFDALPLAELLQTDLVCPRFATLQVEALVKRKDVVICIGGAYTDQLLRSELFYDRHQFTTREEETAEERLIDFMAVDAKTLDHKKVHWLSSHLRNVTSLRLAIGVSCDLADVTEPIAQLLENWSGTLENLGISFMYTRRPPSWQPDKDVESPPEVLRRLLGVINRKLLSLESFTLDWPSYIKYTALWSLNLPVIRRLKVFSTNIEPRFVIDSLKHYGVDNANLQEIRLSNGFIQVADLMKIPADLASKCTVLPADFGGEDDPATSLNTFSERFNGLERLFLSNVNINLRDVFRSLAPLASKLVHLDINAQTISMGSPMFPEKALPRFSALETLILSGLITEHSWLDCLEPLEQLLPSLKRFRVYMDISECTTCGTNLSRSEWQSCLESAIGVLRSRFVSLDVNMSLYATQKLPRNESEQRMSIAFNDGARYPFW